MDKGKDEEQEEEIAEMMRSWNKKVDLVRRRLHAKSPRVHADPAVGRMTRDQPWQPPATGALFPRGAASGGLSVAM
jgi:hypothetical protein